MPTTRIQVHKLITTLGFLLAGATAQTFNCTGSSTTFTAPATGLYHIVANGAQGGNGNLAVGGPLGGLGAQVAGDFTLTGGQTLTIAVGCAGLHGIDAAGGGGGGTFVVTVAGSTPLLIAAGGGGVGLNAAAGGPGQTTIAGASGGGVGGGAGGINGNGGGAGANAGAGGGGAGFNTAGGNGAGAVSGLGGQPFPTLTAGAGGGTGGNGGFGGGGGAGATAGGGGGGYSGGGGADGDAHLGGGGGGSFISIAAANTSSSAGANSGDGSVMITFLAPPTFTKAFGATTILVGASTALTFTITNPNAFPLTGIMFTDTLPAGLVVSTPPGITGMCGGAVSAASGSNTINLAGGMLGANSSCTIQVNVTGTMFGSFTNTTGPITADVVGPGGAAIATISVGIASLDIPFQSKIFPNLTVGDSLINIGNTGASAIVPPGGGFPTGGNLCVNVYEFSPDEQLVACCTCLVTPNGVVTTTTRQLISKTLTPAVPTTITVKLLATAPTGTGTTCNPATPGAISPGLIAFGTNLHVAPVGGSINTGTFAMTETPFIPGTLSAAELTRITTLCGFILANGTGFGVCPGCTIGAAGASRQ